MISRNCVSCDFCLSFHFSRKRSANQNSHSFARRLREFLISHLHKFPNGSPCTWTVDGKNWCVCVCVSVCVCVLLRLTIPSQPWLFVLLFSVSPFAVHLTSLLCQLVTVRNICGHSRWLTAALVILEVYSTTCCSLWFFVGHVNRFDNQFRSYFCIPVCHLMTGDDPFWICIFFYDNH